MGVLEGIDILNMVMITVAVYIQVAFHWRLRRGGRPSPEINNTDKLPKQK
jgi:hypothetical protein